MSPTTPLHQKPALGSTRKPLGQFTPSQATRSQSPFTHGQRLQRAIALKARAHGDRGQLPLSLPETPWNLTTPETQAADSLTSPTSQAPTLQQRSDHPETAAPATAASTSPDLSAPALQQPYSPQAPSGEASETPAIAEPVSPLATPTLQQQPDRASGQQDLVSGQEPDAPPPAAIEAPSIHQNSLAPTLQQASETPEIAAPASLISTPTVQQQPDPASGQGPDTPPPAAHETPSTQQSSAAPTLQQASDSTAESLTAPSSLADPPSQRSASTEAPTHEANAAQSLASEPVAQSPTVPVTDAHPSTISPSESPSPLDSTPSSASPPALQRKTADESETPASPLTATTTSTPKTVLPKAASAPALPGSPAPPLPGPQAESTQRSPNNPTPDLSFDSKTTPDNANLNNPTPPPSFDSATPAPALQTQPTPPLQRKSAPHHPANPVDQQLPLTTETLNHPAPTLSVPNTSAPSPLPKPTNPAIPNAPSPIDPIHPQLQAAPNNPPALPIPPSPHSSPAPPLPSSPAPPLPPPSWNNLNQLLTTPTPPEAWASQFDLQPPIAEDLTNPFIPPSAQEPAAPAPPRPSSPAPPPPGSPANCDPDPEILKTLAQATLRWIYNDLTLSQTRHHARTPYPPPWLSQPFLPMHPGHQTLSQQPDPDLKQHLQTISYPDVPQLNALVQELKQRLQSKLVCDRDRHPLTTYR